MKILSRLILTILLIALSACGKDAQAAKYAQIFETLLTAQRASGVTLAGGKVYFYTPGTETLKTIYVDRAKTTSAANPYTLSADGTAMVYGDGLYDIKLTNSADVQKAFWEDVLIQSSASSLANLSDYGSSLATAISSIGATKTTLNSDVDNNLAVDATAPSTLEINPINGAVITIASGKTLTINGPFNPPAGVKVFAGDGAVAGLRYAQVDWFATCDGVTEESALVQKAINAVTNGDVHFPAGKTCVVANLQLKTGVNLYGHGVTLKLPNNAHSQSYNGSVIDTIGNYPNNVIGTTLNHDGGANYDAGVRAKDPTNATYIVTDLTISGFNIDGNKANNTLGDVGENGSAMGAGISLHQAARIKVQGNRIYNARLDGIHLGYSLHGGSDDCIIENNTLVDNGRTGMALVTGKRNRLVKNTVTGTDVALDIEANLADEIDYQHTVENNYFGGTVSVNALAGTMAGTIISNNTIVSNSTKHGIWLQGGDQTAGMIISNNRLTGSGANSAAFNIIGGINATGIPVTITGNVVSGYDFITSVPSLSSSYLIMKGNQTSTKYGVNLVRPHRVEISNNTITFTGGGSASSAFYMSFSAVTSVPLQGEVLISNNKIRGSGVKRLIESITGSDPPTFNASTLVISANEFDVTSALTDPLIDIDQDVTVRWNKFNHFNYPINYLGTVNGSRFTDNEFVNTGTRSDLFTIPSLFKRVTITGNKLTNINLKVTRPEYCDISGNTVRNGKTVIAYSSTSGGAGSNLISGNRMLNSSGVAIDYAFQITGTDGVDWAAGDFSGNDIIMGNTHAGTYTTPAAMNTTPQTKNYNSF